MIHVTTCYPFIYVYLRDICLYVIFYRYLQEKIKKRGVPYEVNSKVLTSEYLQDIENLYKLDYLKNIVLHSHVLVYDWTKEGDITSMVEDIEQLNFDYDKSEKKMSDWRFESVEELRSKRRYYEDRYLLHLDYIRNEYSVPELFYTATEDEELQNIKEEVYICIHDNCLFAMEFREFFNRSVITQSCTIINKITNRTIKKATTGNDKDLISLGNRHINY